MSYLGNNPKALSAVITSLGGSIVDDASFSFPVERVVEAIPKLNDLGIECKTIRQFRDLNPRSGKEETIAVFNAYPKADPSSLPKKGSYTGNI